MTSVTRSRLQNELHIETGCCTKVDVKFRHSSFPEGNSWGNNNVSIYLSIYFNFNLYSNVYLKYPDFIVPTHFTE